MSGINDKYGGGLIKKNNVKRHGGPAKYQKGKYNIYVRASFSMVVMCVKLLTKLMLILSLG